MSVRQGLLALLAEGPKHGYQLRAEFEARTGGTWPLNIGQAYTTLQRLHRDGLVEPLTGGAEGDPERFELTASGRGEVAAWWQTPVQRGAPARDELAIKLALAVTTPGVDVRGIVDRQRAETLRCLQDYTRLKMPRNGAPGSPGAGRGAAADLAWHLILDSLIFAAQAEIQWLDHVEARVARAALEAARRASAEDGADAPSEPGTHR
ncbi:DNA-binding PadR family transcriptional regulator [Nocardiopsis mwathae]|uniref:DNA-binding PadR family transcriptional regulator n=1 Tax=Nocardiopsis mwathae TaxID=1472723 RepID=A0A7W9YEL3_9ACTN|nr:PadR family transcriptional regulator [Nocardiopsis mwathae]MBB6170041.1 DNA-binding PadR family transcriptional regulator [Nocardiopsis mwathae]